MFPVILPPFRTNFSVPQIKAPGEKSIFEVLSPPPLEVRYPSFELFKKAIPQVLQNKKLSVETLRSHLKIYKAALKLDTSAFTSQLKNQMEFALNKVNFNLIQALLETGFDPNCELSDAVPSNLLLNNLCLYKIAPPIHLIALCLEKGAKPKALDRNGNSPLFSFIAILQVEHHFEMSYSSSLFSLFSHFGVDFTAKKDGESALAYLYRMKSCAHQKQVVQDLLHIQQFAYSNDLHQRVKIQKSDFITNFSHHNFSTFLQKERISGYRPLTSLKFRTISKKEQLDLIKDKTDLTGIFEGAVKFVINPHENTWRSIPLIKRAALAWEVLYNHICEGDTPIQIESSPAFKQLVLNAIKDLIHFPSGRAIIWLLIHQQNDSVLIVEASTGNGSTSRSTAAGQPALVSIDLTNLADLTCLDAQGNQVSKKSKASINLGHELLHAIHDLVFPQYRSIFDKASSDQNYTNLCELLAIEGVFSFPISENSLRYESGELERYGHRQFPFQSSSHEEENESTFQVKRRKVQ